MFSRHGWMTWSSQTTAEPKRPRCRDRNWTTPTQDSVLAGSAIGARQLSNTSCLLKGKMSDIPESDIPWVRHQPTQRMRPRPAIVWPGASFLEGYHQRNVFFHQRWWGNRGNYVWHNDFTKTTDSVWNKNSGMTTCKKCLRVWVNCG